MSKIIERYDHDCESCVFLGPYQQFDLYYCGDLGRLSTVIARWSSDGPDYASGMCFAVARTIEELAVALDRAVQMGLCDKAGVPLQRSVL